MNATKFLEVIQTGLEWVSPVILRILKSICSGSIPQLDLPFKNPCQPVYGAYLEKQRLASAKRYMREQSIILVKPKHSFFWFKWGILIEGLCINRHKEVRDFESLKVFVQCLNPIVCHYNYFANSKGNPIFNDGFIRFFMKHAGKYEKATGYFILPIKGSKTKPTRNVMVNFDWYRLSGEEIQARIGKKSLENITDIRCFFRSRGDL